MIKIILYSEINKISTESKHLFVDETDVISEEYQYIISSNLMETKDGDFWKRNSFGKD